VHTSEPRFYGEVSGPMTVGRRRKRSPVSCLGVLVAHDTRMGSEPENFGRRASLGLSGSFYRSVFQQPSPDWTPMFYSLSSSGGPPGVQSEQCEIAPKSPVYNPCCTSTAVCHHHVLVKQFLFTTTGRFRRMNERLPACLLSAGHWIRFRVDTPCPK